MIELEKIRISQSLMKDLSVYKNKNSCGIQLVSKYIDGVQFPSSDVMELGNYFEFICTGSVARDGHIPMAEMTKSGKLTAKYENAHAQKKNFDKVMNHYGFILTETDHHFDNGEANGIADIIATRNGERVIIDTKFSGLLENKWEDRGWADESIETKDTLLIQAVHYKLLAYDEWGVWNMPFFFMVFSNTNPTDYKVFEIICDEDTLEKHKLNIVGAKKYFINEFENGFKPRPNYKECSKCPLADGCEYFTDVPDITIVYY